MDFYTIRALARDWEAALRGATLRDAWTQSPREATLLFQGDPGPAHAVRVICDPALPLVFRAAGAARQKRNTADVLAGAVGAAVRCVRVAERDRHLLIDLDRGRLQVVLFGSRPNVFWTNGEGVIQDAFLDGPEWKGETVRPRPAPTVDTADAFADRWRARKTLAQSVAGAAPLLTRDLAGQALRRAGLDPDAPPDEADVPALFETVRQFEAALEAPRPHVVWRGPLAHAFTLVEPAGLPDGQRAEPFRTVDAAVSVWAKRSLGQRA